MQNSISKHNTKLEECYEGGWSEEGLMRQGEQHIQGPQGTNGGSERQEGPRTRGWELAGRVGGNVLSEA